jgi:hypothetical protein
MSRSDDIVELLTSLAHLCSDRPHRCYLILLSAYPHFPLRLIFNVRQLVVRFNFLDITFHSPAGVGISPSLRLVPAISSTASNLY